MATIAKPIPSSYEIICAEPRMPPSSEKRLFDAQPAEDDAVDAERHHRQHVEDADVEAHRLQVDHPVADLQDVAERNGGEGDDRGKQVDARRQGVQQAIDAAPESRLPW